MLYRPEAFEPLTDEPWAEQRVSSAIRAIVADADDALRGPRLLWKADEWDRWHGTSPMKNLYVGAAGVLWALEALRRRVLQKDRSTRLLFLAERARVGRKHEALEQSPMMRRQVCAVSSLFLLCSPGISGVA